MLHAWGWLGQLVRQHGCAAAAGSLHLVGEPHLVEALLPRHSQVSLLALIPQRLEVPPHCVDVVSQLRVRDDEADHGDAPKLQARAHDLGQLCLIRQHGTLRREVQPDHGDRVVDGADVVEDGLPGLPFASALIDLFHHECEGAAEYERGCHGEQPLAHRGGDTDLVGAVQQGKSDDERGDGAQSEPNDQHNVRLARESGDRHTVRPAHARSLPSTGTCRLPRKSSGIRLVIARPEVLLPPLALISR
jgi:hypothetical protein